MMFRRVFKHLRPTVGFVKLRRFSSRQLSSSEFTNRSHTCGQLGLEDVGKEVTLCGWIQFKRMDKFVVLRDSYGTTQLVIDNQLSKKIRNLMPESVIKVAGKVSPRPKKDRNLSVQSGQIEVQVDHLDVLSACKQDIPFIIRDFQDVNEELRLRYRHIDLRNQQMQERLRLRSAIVMKMRNYLIDKCFVEVETPTIFKKTPGGAREFIVPTSFPNKFYSLTQSPQQFKQLLMMGGVDRYFQVARCYRDEGTKPDRQPEFTQLDLEMSFTTMEGIINLIEDLLVRSLPQPEQIKVPFERITYKEAMEKYDSDKPDLRQVDGVASQNKYAFLWVTDFPLFVGQKDDPSQLESTHHPFTAPKQVEDVFKDPLSAISQHFDLVLNGQEVGGGSIRIHDAEFQEYVLKDILKEDIQEMKYFLEAMKCGCPPHGGIALGLDRLMAIILDCKSIRDVIAFPKSSGGNCLLSGAPTIISNETKNYYHIKPVDKQEKENLNQHLAA